MDLKNLIAVPINEHNLVKEDVRFNITIPEVMFIYANPVVNQSGELIFDNVYTTCPNSEYHPHYENYRCKKTNKKCIHAEFKRVK
jgi:hypothetical protein